MEQRKHIFKNVFELLIPIIIVPGPGNQNSAHCWQKETYFLNVWLAYSYYYC